MFILAKRNILIYFKDKTGVFFSLLSVLIVVALFVLFLGDNLTSSYEHVMEDASVIINHWIFAGILGVASVTTTLGAFSVMMNDKVHKISKDFYTSPIQKSRIVAGYALGAFFIGSIMSVIIFIILILYSALIGDHMMSVLTMLKVLGVLLFSVMLNAFMLFFMTTFIKTNQAFNAISTMMGTLIGFLMGIYVPIGLLPTPVQRVIQFFPQSHTTMLFRQFFLEGISEDTFYPVEYFQYFQESMGIVYIINDSQFTRLGSVLFLGMAALCFLILSIWRASKNMSSTK